MKSLIASLLLLAAAPALAQESESAPEEDAVQAEEAPAAETEDNAADALEGASTPQEMFDAAQTAYAMNDFQTAQIAATAAAAEGNAQAMTLIGYMHERGLGGVRDEVKAINWYRAAAKKGEPDALMALAAYALEEEHGLTTADARSYLDRALGAGRSEAAIDLASLYMQGLGGPPDRQKALLLLETAAEEGGADAAYRAGVVLSEEDTGEQDDARAADYFKRAAENGHPAGATLYGHALYEGVGVPADKPAAAEWYAKAAKRGDTEGQVYHALMLALVDGDVEKSAYWLERSRISEGEDDAVAAYAPIRAKLDNAIAGKLTGEEIEAVRADAHDDAGA